ncbi:MAG: hypothetical protein ACD_24C00436G0001 [uncultured bacterium]|nr:MAG: hypothetical protein ACD_24C00436G0001 [uncultured bacterium]
MAALSELFLGRRLIEKEKEARSTSLLTPVQFGAIEIIRRLLPDANKTTKKGLKYSLVGQAVAVWDGIEVIGERIDLILANNVRYGDTPKDGYARNFANQLESASDGLIRVLGDPGIPDRRFEVIEVGEVGQSAQVFIIGGNPHSTGYLRSAVDRRNLDIILLAPSKPLSSPGLTPRGKLL